MSAETLYSDLAKRGITLTLVDDEHIGVSSARPLDNIDRRVILRFKPQLLQILADQRLAAQTAFRQAGVLQFAIGEEHAEARLYRPADGQVFPSLFAFDTETEMIDDEGWDSPELALATASDGQTHILIHPDDLAAFVLAHQRQHVVCHNVAFDFWVVHKHLVDQDQTRVVESWIDSALRGRLHDTMLLDMLIRLAHGVANSEEMYSRDLGVVAGEYGDVILDKNSPYRTRFDELIGADWPDVDLGFFKYAVLDTIATARAYRVMRQRARELTQPFLQDGSNDVFADAAQRFGLLTERVQVGAAIALDRIRRNGLRTDRRRLAKTRHKLTDQVDEAFKKLYQSCPELFKAGPDGKLKRTSTNVPSQSRKVLEQQLEAAVTEINARAESEVSIPRTSKGNISIAAEAWSSLRDQHPFIETWLEYVQATKLAQFLGVLDSPEIHPHYRVLARSGRTGCSSPNLQQIPRLDEFREVLVPSPGNLLLIVDYKYIELVTLAAICLTRFGRSRLAEVIRDGVDPHCYTAAMLLGMEYDEFMALKETDASQFKTSRQLAKPINFGVPGGMGPPALTDYARSTYHVEMSLAQAAEFHERLTKTVYPELSTFLADSNLEDLASGLCISRKQLLETLRRDPDRLSMFLWSIRKVVAGMPYKQDGTPYSVRYVDEIWNILTDANQNPEIATLLANRIVGNSLDDRLFPASVATLTGRIRADVTYTARRNTQFQGLAADGAKIALTRLVLGGYRAVGFVHDEILIELPERGRGFVSQAEVDTVIEIVRGAMEEVTCGIPVECEYAVSTCWSKRAELIQRRGRVYGWKPPA